MHALAILSVHATLLLAALPGPVPVPTGTTTTFTFNSAEQLTQVRRTTSPAQTLATSTYDGDGERVTKTEGSTTVIYVRDPSGNVLAEYNAGTGALVANYVYLNGHKVCRVAADGSRRYFHHDPLGTPRAVTNASGTALWRGEHRPFGEVHTSNPAGGDNYTFTGHEWEDESALLYAHARYYDPTVGRFLSTDPVGGRGDNPQSWNRYAYVQNNPMTVIDPDGRSIWGTLWKITAIMRDSEKRRVVLQAFEGRSKQKAVQRTQQALDRVEPQKARRVVEAETPQARDAMASQLSTNKRIRGPERSPGYPEHVHPAEGPYTGVHVESRTSVVAGGAAVGQMLGEVFAPASSAVSQVSDATVGEVVSALVWDVASAVDPLGATDLIGWAAGLP